MPSRSNDTEHMLSNNFEARNLLKKMSLDILRICLGYVLWKKTSIFKSTGQVIGKYKHANSQNGTHLHYYTKTLFVKGNEMFSLYWCLKIQQGKWRLCSEGVTSLRIIMNQKPKWAISSAFYKKSWISKELQIWLMPLAFFHAKRHIFVAWPPVVMFLWILGEDCIILRKWWPEKRLQYKMMG